jgi:hypothetical protein
MLKNALIALAFALPMMCVGAAAAQSAERADGVQRSSAVVRIAALLQAANEANDLFLQALEETERPGDRAEVRRRIAELRSTAEQAGALVTRVRDEFQVIEMAAFGAERDEIAAALCAESFVYLDGLGHVIALSLELASALEGESRAQILMVRQRLWLSVGITLDGRIALVHARQQLAPTTETAHHRLGAMAALYEGMRAIVLPTMLNRPEALQSAAQSAAAWGQSGHGALAAQRAALPAQSPMREALALEAQALDLNERVATILQNAARDARAGVPSADLYMRYMGELGRIERQYIELGRTPARPLNELVPLQEV